MAMLEQVNPAYGPAMGAQFAQGTGGSDAARAHNAGNATEPAAVGGHMTSTTQGMAMLKELQANGMVHGLDILA